MYGSDAKQKSFLVFAEHTAALKNELVSERGTRAQPASRDCRMVAILQKIAAPAYKMAKYLTKTADNGPISKVGMTSFGNEKSKRPCNC